MFANPSLFELCFNGAMAVICLIALIPLCIAYDKRQDAAKAAAKAVAPKPVIINPPASQPTANVVQPKGRGYCYQIKEKDPTSADGLKTVGTMIGLIFNEGTKDVDYEFDGRRATEETKQDVARETFYARPENASLRSQYCRSGIHAVPSQKSA